MSVYSGSLAITRYRVVGDPGRTTNASLSKLLDAFRASPIKFDGPAKPESIGWVRPLTPNDAEISGEDAHWDMTDCRVRDGYLLRSRYERRKVSSALLNMLYRNKLDAHLQKTGKTMRRDERQKLKHEIVLDLTKRTLPSLQFTDVFWRDEASELIIFSTSKSVRQRIEQLFYQTFGSKLDLSLIRIDGSLAFFDDDTATEKDLLKRLGRLSELQPSLFALQTER
jgi:hypothetical protein